MRAFTAMLVFLLVSLTAWSCSSDSTAPVLVASLSVAPRVVSIPIGRSAQLSATARDSSGGTIVDRQTSWSTSDDQVANVGADGLVNAISLGSSLITATSDGKSDTVTIAVVPPLRNLAASRNFVMGAAVDMAPYRNDSLYRQVLAAEYNGVVAEGAMKIKATHPSIDQYSFTDADELVQFAQSNRMVIHGHTLVWYAALPTWLTERTFTKTELLAVLKDYVTTVVSRYQGKIATWDVVNEVLDGDGTLRKGIWLDVIGPEYIDSAFVWANRADPAAKLYINENWSEGMGRKSDSLYALVQALRTRGIPVHGVGFQAHFSMSPPPASSIRMNLARFGSAGYDIRVSEMDAQVPDTAGVAALDEEANIYKDMLDACLQVSSCVGFTTWGFTDRYSWLPAWRPGIGRGLPFDENYHPKPAYTALSTRLKQP